MTPDAALGPLEEPKNQPPSTAGMTTKVVKGSMWTLAGSVLPLAVSFISTPFVIRFLGAEGYGVLLLVGLIPTYFNFADFGMGLASTKFASEAFGEGDREKERRIVWTAGTIAVLSSIVIALPIFLFSYRIVTILNVPAHLAGEASIGLKLTSGGFVIGILALVLNSPILARLRLDLNSLSQAGPRVLLAVLTPVVLYFGAGIVGAVSLSFVISLVTLGIVLWFSARLLRGFWQLTFDTSLVRPLLRFGGGMLIAMIAAMLLINLEKLFLTRMVSVEALAYYSVAFTFANMATLFSSAMTQSLLPAFARLQAPEKQSEFRALFGRAIRFNILWLLPAMMLMLVGARPFFSLWAGEAFGRESTLPFCILLIGLFFNVLAYVPHATITAKGHTHVFAKLYWIELVVYAGLAYLLIARFGIAGAATAWTIRSALDALLIIIIAKRTAGVSFPFERIGYLGVLPFVILPVLFVVTIYTDFSLLLIPVVCGVILAYAFMVWRIGVDESEREWLRDRLTSVLRLESSKGNY